MNAYLDSAEGWLRHLALLSWKGTLLTLAAGLSLVLLRRHLSPAWRHGLWLLVLMRFLLPDLGTSSFSINGVAEVPGITAEAVTPPENAEVPVMPFEVLPEEGPPAPALAPVSVVKQPATMAEAPPWALSQLLTAIWLAGVVAVLGIMLVLHLRLLGRVRRDSASASAEVTAILREACRLARVARMPRLIVTDAIRAPSLFGILRPAVLLPRALAATENAAGLKLIFLHELAHLKRWDLGSQIIASLVIALHWCNPAVWWAGRRLRAEAEMAADGHALRCTEAKEAHRMGELLLGFANHAAAAWVLSFLAVTQLGISDNKRDLRRRIEALMDIARGRRTRWVVGLGLFFVLALTGLTKAPAQEAAQTKTADPTPATVPGSKGMRTVAGRVLDAEGKPVANATCMLRIGDAVEFEQRKALSDADGRFQFEGVPESAPIRAWARHADYLEVRYSENDVPPEEAANLKLVLQPITSWVSGTIKEKAGGQPVKGATVFLAVGTLAKLPAMTWLGMPSSQATQATTDEAGHYRLPRKTQDNNGALVVVAPGMKMTKTKFEWRENNVTLDHALEVERGVSGKVTTAEGKPVEGASLSLAAGYVSVGRALTKARTSDLHYSAGQGIWLGNPLTDSNGEFSGRTFQEEEADDPWVIAQHPEHGIQYKPLREWKNGETLQLAKWNALQGTLVDAEGNLQKGKEIKLLQSEYSRDTNVTPRLRFSISNHLTGFTDGQGRYKFERLLPRFDSGSALVDGQYIRLPAGGWTPGKPLDLTLRMPPKAGPAPKNQARHMEGRIQLPAAPGVKLPEHDIVVNVSREGGQEGTGKTEVDGEGRFTTNMLPPGRYKLRIQVEPKDRTLIAPQDNGLSMLFTVEPTAGRELQDLGEFQLDAADFAFTPRPASSKKSTSERREQKVDAPAENAASFVSWSGSGSAGPPPAFKFTPDGRMMGPVPVSTNLRFMLRATKADGTRHFTAAQIGTENSKEAFKTRLSFNPGVAVEGHLRDLPEDHNGDGWVVAVVRVNAEAPLNTVQKGPLPYANWFAWAPVRKDGSFRFPSLPRGSLEIAGFGEGWVTRNPGGSSTDVSANLLTAGPALKLTLDTEPCLSGRVRVLRPDGSPAAGAHVTVVPPSGLTLGRAFGHWGFDREEADTEAYSRFKKQPIPGHEAVANAEGEVRLRNLPHQYLTCEVRWMDPNKKAEQVEKAQVQMTRHDPTIKLAGIQP
ncbi:MAG: M56 family metallopeptidase [Prosthecobacter sp.]